MTDRLRDWVRARRHHERQMTHESAIGSAAESWHAGRSAAFAEVLDRLEADPAPGREPTLVELLAEAGRLGIPVSMLPEAIASAAMARDGEAEEGQR